MYMPGTLVGFRGYPLQIELAKGSKRLKVSPLSSKEYKSQATSEGRKGFSFLFLHFSSLFPLTRHIFPSAPTASSSDLTHPSIRNPLTSPRGTFAALAVSPLICLPSYGRSWGWTPHRPANENRKLLVQVLRLFCPSSSSSATLSFCFLFRVTFYFSMLTFSSLLFSLLRSFLSW